MKRSIKLGFLSILWEFTINYEIAIVFNRPVIIGLLLERGITPINDVMRFTIMLDAYNGKLSETIMI